MHTLELSPPGSAQEPDQSPAAPAPSGRRLSRAATFGQLLRFGLVGSLNTLIDLLVLNSLFWLFPPRNTGLLLSENAIAFSVGASNSFLFNKYWTFRCGGRVRRRELGRFALMTLAGVVCNTLLLWLLSSLLHPLFMSPVLWANASKLVAIGGTVLISYLGMRLWVFVRPAASPFVNCSSISVYGGAQRRPNANTLLRKCCQCSWLLKRVHLYMGKGKG